MHLIINFGDFDCLDNPHASLPLAGLSHWQPPGGRWGHTAGIETGGSLRLLLIVARIVIQNVKFTERKLLWNDLFMPETNLICSLKLYLNRIPSKSLSFMIFHSNTTTYIIYSFKYYSYRVGEHRKWIQITGWFRKIKSTDSNIEERVNNSPIFIKAKI